MPEHRAPKDLYGVDGYGVRRKVRAGSLIPAGLRVEEPLPAPKAPPEQRLLEQRRARRARS